MLRKVGMRSMGSPLRRGSGRIVVAVVVEASEVAVLLAVFDGVVVVVERGVRCVKKSVSLDVVGKRKQRAWLPPKRER